MTFLLDSNQVPVAERADAVRAIVASTIVPVAIDFPSVPGPIVKGAITDFGRLRVCAVRSNATKVERTPRLARDDLPPSVFLGLQMTGTSLVVQDDREAVLRPGDLVLYDTTAPYTLVDADGIRQYQIRIPIDELALPRDLIRKASAVTLSPGHPVADLAAAYFQRMASRPDLVTQPGAAAVSQPSTELVRALITTHLDATAPDRDALNTTLPLRIMEYVRAHLSDPDLSPTQIAAEHHISLRHLYNILAGVNVSLGTWIRTQRLDACRTDLTRAELATITIAAVARRWGFTDPSSFGRLFRAEFGMSPREWRAAQNTRRKPANTTP